MAGAAVKPSNLSGSAPSMTRAGRGCEVAHGGKLSHGNVFGLHIYTHMTCSHSTDPVHACIRSCMGGHQSFAGNYNHRQPCPGYLRRCRRATMSHFRMMPSMGWVCQPAHTCLHNNISVRVAHVPVAKNNHAQRMSRPAGKHLSRICHQTCQ